ncbi:helix-turn-helix domain-containing protein [Merismopedia glauca]|nr:helix-turn-helix transcriptional regulator [Merismopedia glauca]
MKQPLIAKFIRALRQELNLTQEQFAAELGVTFPTVNRWENGKTKPSPIAQRLIQIRLKDMGLRGQKLLDSDGKAN